MDSIASMESQLGQARNMRNGEWIERCCFQERQKLRNRGAKEAKNATYQFRNIQRFKSVADYTSWMTGVIQAIKSRAGGDELVHLMHVINRLSRVEDTFSSGIQYAHSRQV